MQEYVTATELADMFGITRDRVFNLMQNFETIAVGQRFRKINLASAKAWFAANPSKLAGDGKVRIITASRLNVRGKGMRDILHLWHRRDGGLRRLPEIWAILTAELPDITAQDIYSCDELPAALYEAIVESSLIERHRSDLESAEGMASAIDVTRWERFICASVPDDYVEREEGPMVNQRIRDRRIELGLTQSEVADSAGINMRTYQRIECGDSIPKSDTLMAIADALSVSMDALIEHGMHAVYR